MRGSSSKACPPLPATSRTARGRGRWERLYPAERHRIVNLMLERLDIVPGGLKVSWRELGWKALIVEFAPDSIGAELIELEAS